MKEKLQVVQKLDMNDNVFMNHSSCRMYHTIKLFNMIDEDTLLDNNAHTLMSVCVCMYIA